MEQPASMKEAKAHFRSYTRSVLARWAREELKKGIAWTQEDGYPVLRAGELALRFYKENGHVAATTRRPPQGG